MNSPLLSAKGSFGRALDTQSVRRFLVPAAAATAVAIMLLGLHFYRHRFVRQNSDLVRLLPPGDLTLIYADLGLMRRAQLLGMLANIKVATDQQYADFVRETGFDYTRDLDAIVIGTGPAQTFLVGRGRFAWDKLKGFALSHSGVCTDAGCQVRASTPGRWVNLITVQPDVLAVAISANPTAADELRPPGRRVQEEIPSAPVWARLSHAMLTNPASLPLPVQIFVISLQSAGSVTISAMPDKLELQADFANAATADTAMRQLQRQTKVLRTALGQDAADASSLGAMLTSGNFWLAGSQLRAIWPVKAELLRALE
jgi:hypothetical protein